MKDDYTTNSHYLTITFLFRRAGEMYILNLGVKGLLAFPFFQIWSSIDHVSIVHLEEVFYTRSSLLMVLEYLPGGDLFDGIVARRHYSERDACACIRQILVALKYLRRKQIVHRVSSQRLELTEKASTCSLLVVRVEMAGAVNRACTRHEILIILTFTDFKRVVKGVLITFHEEKIVRFTVHGQ